MRGVFAFLPFLFFAAEVGIQLFQDFVAGLFQVHIEIAQHLRSHAFAFAQQTEKQVLRADIGMIQRLGFLRGQRENFFHARCVRDVAGHLRVGPGADVLLDLHPHGVEIHTEFRQHIDGHALAELDESEEQVLGPDIIVIEAISLLAGERQDLLSAWGKVIHHRSQGVARNRPHHYWIR